MITTCWMEVRSGGPLSPQPFCDNRNAPTHSNKIEIDYPGPAPPIAVFDAMWQSSPSHEPRIQRLLARPSALCNQQIACSLVTIPASEVAPTSLGATTLSGGSNTGGMLPIGIQLQVERNGHSQDYRRVSTARERGYRSLSTAASPLAAASSTAGAPTTIAPDTSLHSLQ